MKKIIILFSFLISMSSCATNVEVRLEKKYKGIDNEFKPYISEFIHMSDGKVTYKNFDNFSIGFRKYDSKDSTVGTCHYFADEVDISVDWWFSDFNTPSERLELVFHELGHCILKRGHSSKPYKGGFVQWLERVGFRLGIFTEKGYLYDGCPASFMHPYTLGENCINKHFSYYIKELFHQENTMNYIESRHIDRYHFTHNKCSEPIIINKTDTWDKRDRDTLNRAKMRCIEVYGTCLKSLTKVLLDGEHVSYRAICE